jgi:23S rRNA G2445 N2-methylase RlmL
MNAFATCILGLEPVSLKEIKELTSASASVAAPGILRFSASPEQLCLLAYRSQSLSRIGLAGKLATTASKEDLLRHGTDIAGVDLAKREYLVNGSNRDIASTAAYAMVCLSGFKKGSILLDPFCRSGSIAIEAALYASKLPPQYYNKDAFAFHTLKEFSSMDTHAVLEKADRKLKKEKIGVFNYSPVMGNVSIAEKNARMAGVNKLISFGRLDPDILDLKFEQKLDCIVSVPPREQLKQLPTLFKRASPILKKGARIVIAASDEQAVKAAAKNFRLLEQYDFPVGSAMLHTLVFGRA